MRMPTVRSRRAILTGMLVLAGGITATVLASQGSADIAVQTTEPWPSFVMVYTETAEGFGLNGAVGTQRVRVEYTDQRHFKTTVLEHSAVPEAVGLTGTFDGQTSTSYDPHTGHTRVTQWGPDEVTVPHDWLVPGKVPPLARRPGATVKKLGNGIAAVVREETSRGRRFQQESRYREADGIPVGIVEILDGRVVRRGEVVELQLGSR